MKCKSFDKRNYTDWEILPVTLTDCVCAKNAKLSTHKYFDL